MAKLLSFIAVFCLMTTIIADDCNNPLLSVFGFTSLGTPQAVPGLNYCKSLQNGTSCCSATTINTIQDKATELAKKLSDIVAARDKAIVETRDQIIPGIQTSINQLKENSQKAMAKIVEQMGQLAGNLGNMGGASLNISGLPFSSDMTTGIATAMQSMSDAITGNLSTVKGQFKDFQKQRSPCVIELLKLQSSAWCLACDPAWATKGVTVGDVSMSSRVCQRVQSACFQFISGAAQQSAVLAMKTVGPILSSMATLMGNIANNGLAGATGVEGLESMISGSSSQNPSNSTMSPVDVPPGCTEGNCNWICDTMFSNGQLDADAITAGGVQSATTNPFSTGGTRLLAEEQPVVRRKLIQNRKRMLANNEWDPDSDEAGVTVTFSDDPAGVGNSGAGLIKVGVISMLAMIAAFVF